MGLYKTTLSYQERHELNQNKEMNFSHRGGFKRTQSVLNYCGQSLHLRLKGTQRSTFYNANYTQ